MAGLNPESLAWIDKLNTLKAQPPDTSRSELQKALNLTNTQITEYKKIKDCFDPAAIEKVRQAASPQQTGTSQGNPPHIFSYRNALALAGLNGRVDDLPTAVHTALDVVLTRQLATKDIKKLVAWVISGKPAAEFDPKEKAVKPPPSANKALGQPNLVAQPDASQQVNASLDLKKIRQLLEKAEAERIQGNETTEQDKLIDHLRKIFGSSPSKTSKDDSLSDEVLSETILLDWLADIPVLARIKSKRKKGKSLSAGEWCLLVGHKAGNGFGHLCKLVLKLAKPFLKLLHMMWKLVIEALKELGLYKYAKAIFTIVALVAALWFGWEAFHYGVMRPVEMIWSKIHFTHVAEESPTPSANGSNNEPLAQPSLSPQLVVSAKAPTPPSTTSRLQTVSHWFPEKKTEKPAPAMVYQPSVSFAPTNSSASGTLYDPKILETEMAAISPNSIVKDYPMTPDEGMPGDLAVSRMQDLTDPDKYTMKIGKDTEKILSVSPSHTTLTVAYKSGDALGGFVDGSGQMNFFWEDVKTIHINEIDVETSTPAVLYQCSLIVSGSKNPLTIQCASIDDLEHLVSTMEYFIRSSRLAHDAQPAGLPYPTQGLVLSNDCVVVKLWAGSPMDKAGVTLGDHLWSIGKVTSEKQGRNDLETGLSKLPVTFFAASPAEWTRATLARNPSLANSFRPKLRKVVLIAS